MGTENTKNSRIVNFASDVDIDFADRQQVLTLIRHVGATKIDNDANPVAHNTGIYATEIPTDPFTNRSSIDYRVAEARGYIKLDFLNVGIYQQVRNESHLLELMNTDPPWHRLYEADFCGQLIHINNHYDTLIKMPEAVNSVPRLAMFLAIIRPAKRHLIGLPWAEVAKTVWNKPADGGYYFKKAHAISYAHLVLVHMNLANFSN
jgi:hypothetical protein